MPSMIHSRISSSVFAWARTSSGENGGTPPTPRPSSSYPRSPPGPWQVKQPFAWADAVAALDGPDVLAAPPGHAGDAGGGQHAQGNGDDAQAAHGAQDQESGDG